jgi:hypothetical protein
MKAVRNSLLNKLSGTISAAVTLGGLLRALEVRRLLLNLKRFPPIGDVDMRLSPQGVTSPTACRDLWAQAFERP